MREQPARRHPAYVQRLGRPDQPRGEVLHPVDTGACRPCRDWEVVPSPTRSISRSMSGAISNHFAATLPDRSGSDSQLRSSRSTGIPSSTESSDRGRAASSARLRSKTPQDSAPQHNSTVTPRRGQTWGEAGQAVGRLRSGEYRTPQSKAFVGSRHDVAGRRRQPRTDRCGAVAHVALRTPPRGRCSGGRTGNCRSRTARRACTRTGGRRRRPPRARRARG